jgi:hypothetical protein
VDFNALVGQLVSSYDWNMVVIGLTGSIDPISGVNVYPSDGNLHMIEPNQESPRRHGERGNPSPPLLRRITKGFRNGLLDSLGVG